MKKFNGENIIDFVTKFDSDQACKEYIAELKWENGFKCKKMRT